MRKKQSIWVFLTLCVMLIPIQNALGAGATVDPYTLRMTLPYVQYLGTPYYVILDYDASKSGASGLFWKFNSIAPSTLQGPCGGTADPTSLNITDLCVLVVGMQFQVTLEFQTADATWKLGGEISQLPGVIASVSGSCYDSYEDIVNDPTYLAIYQCFNSCPSNDLDCYTTCIGGAFRIGLSLSNSTGSPIELTIPPGTTFAPDQSDVQSMMVLQELKFQVQPGDSKQCINVYCTNVHLDAPGLGDTFVTSGGVTQPCLIEILNLTAGKTLSGQDMWQIQNIVWNCIEQGSISAEQKQFLEGL
jgi:hypothetical protein